ncbi:MAG: DUF2267 domain-containing protein [Hyphomicrobiales bacterium]
MTPAYHNTIRLTVQATKEWALQVDEEAGWGDEHRSFQLLRSTLHALRDLLSVDEAAQLSAQLPLLIRGLFFEGWNPSEPTAEHRSKDWFVARITHDFKTSPLPDPEAAITAVFRVLNARISAGEVADIRSALRPQLRDIWPAPAV